MLAVILSLVFQSTFPSRGTTSGNVFDIGDSVFQSTFPSRGTTGRLTRPISQHGYFNPRSPRGERLACRVNGDEATLFQSTFPSRGTTYQRKIDPRTVKISIHVPLAGNDNWVTTELPNIIHFNPRSPRGERLHESAALP